MLLPLILLAAALFLALGVFAVVRAHDASRTVYRACAVLSAHVLLGALGHLLFANAVAALALPLRLPWIGAHFRLDALAAFVPVVVNLSRAAASVYGLGYGRHERAPG